MNPNNSAASILPENTVIISARGTVGKLALTSGDMTMNQSCYGIRGSNGYGQYFILQALKNILTELKNNTHGSVFDTITRQTFSTISTTLPSLRVAQHYENMISKYFVLIFVEN
ncbi:MULTISPECIES: restriction endonuclease subunit S [Acetobacter]|uniref:restriction endonuclease subunit S n=1 Tax=Acetobacter TaxID=434 RepID=UPI0038D13E65